MKQNYEILFVYDVREANPNGDPDLQNQPRMDDDGKNIVSDVRLKRTIRDELMKQSEKVLIRVVEDENGNRSTMDNVCSVFYDEYCKKNNITEEKESKKKQILKKELMKSFIDVRAFGGALTVKGANTSVTGALQFGLGKSLNFPTVKTQTITTSLASGENKGQGSIGSYSYLDYSLIAFRGVVNAYQSEQNGFTKDDLDKVIKSMIDGTNKLNTRSKFNHKARFIIVIKMKEGKSTVGDSDAVLYLENTDKVKSIKDVSLNVSDLIMRLEEYKYDIDSVFIGVENDFTVLNADNLYKNSNFDVHMCDISKFEIK